MLVGLGTVAILLLTWLWVKRYIAESIYKGFKEIPSWPFLGHITYFWNSNHDEAMVGIANDVMKGSDSFVYRNIISSKENNFWIYQLICYYRET